MKKWMYLAVGAVLAGAGWLGAKELWRAHKGLVSVKASNTPIEQVLSDLSRQSGQRICADTNLHARISLRLNNVPLAEALARIARQAGALTGTIHAVYENQATLGVLMSALAAGLALETVGWTNLAPVFDLAHLPKPPGEPQDNLAVDGGPPGRRVQHVTQDIQVSGPGEPGAAGGPHPPHAPVMMMRFQKSDGSGQTHVETWTPERIVTTAVLASRLGADLPGSPSRADAESAATRLKAQCRTLYALKSAPGGMGIDNLMRAPGGQAKISGMLRDGKRPPMGDAVEARIRREKLAQYEDLTPQQRVERQRQMKAGKEETRQENTP